jgi:hypothetical protein
MNSLNKKRKNNLINGKKRWLFLPIYVIYIIVYEFYLGINLFEILGNIIFSRKYKRK